MSSTSISSWQDVITSNRSAPQLDLTQPLPSIPTLEQITTDLENSGFRSDINKALGKSADPEPEDQEFKSKLRSDQFHQYQKQKRTAKIKSKLYHKIRNKKKDKGNTAEEDAENEDLRRIEERISLRHNAKKLKRTVNKYAKDNGKKLISENEALRQRIRNPSRVNSEGNVVYDSSSDEEFLAEQLGLETGGIEEEEEKGVMGMKFMQEAQKRQREKEETLSKEIMAEIKGSKFKFDGKKKGKGEVKGKGEGETRKLKKVENTQEKIIEQAFEMDEMDKVAAEEWAREMDEKKEKEPKSKKGWGNWCGGGIFERQPRESLPVHKVEKVILFEERDKRAAKYLVKKIPFPFKTSKQFDSVHKIPVGKEWNSNRVYQKQIAPEVLTRDGEIIEPISK